jgi:L-threonylcarbamoyladenylate synthase
VRTLSFDERLDIDAALNAGLVVGLPTDTVYGLACRIDRPDALAEIFRLKDRPSEVALPILCDSLETARGLGTRFSRDAVILAKAFWPGPLTLVVGASVALSSLVGSNDESVGLRVPGDEQLLTLLDLTGPLAVTSANLHGDAPCARAEEVEAVFGDRGLEVVVDGGIRQNFSSTVVSCLESALEVKRVGEIQPSQIEAVLSRD